MTGASHSERLSLGAGGVPPEMQAELVEMTWLDDDRLLTIADSTMPDEDQQRMAELSNHDGLAPAQHDALKALRDS